MEVTVLPRGPVTKAGLYPAGATFKGLRTGVTASRPRRKRRSNPQVQAVAQAAAYAKHAAKEAAGKARIAQAEADLTKARAAALIDKLWADMEAAFNGPTGRVHVIHLQVR